MQIFLFCSTQIIFAESLKINLNDAINLALENNRSIEQSADDREIARWNLSASRRSFGPTFSWSMTANRIGGRYYNDRRKRRTEYENMSDLQKNYFGYRLSDFPLYESENYNSINLSFPIYSGGRLESQKKYAEFNLNSADLTLEDTRQQIKWQTAQAYFRVLQMSDLIKVRQEEIDNLKEHLQTVQTQYEVGTVAMNDVLATNVQLANSQQAMNTAQGNYQNAVAALNNLIGFSVDTEIIVQENLKYFVYGRSETECMEYALAHRPDGISAAYEVKKYKESVNAAKAGYRPNISAVVQGSIYGEGVFKADHEPERWSAGVQMSWNLFDNHVTSAQVQQNKFALKKAESVAEQKIETIRLEVHTAFTNLKVAEKNIAVTSEALKKAEEQYLIARIRYEEGVDTNLNVMDSQEKLTQTRTNYFSALYTYNESVAQLDKAIGVPVGFDAKIYSDFVEKGKNSEQAIKNSALNNEVVK